MSYKYEEIKPRLFTPDGMKMVLSVRDKAFDLLKQAGAFRLDKAIEGQSGDTWTMLACVDSMVERGEILDVSRPNCAAQHRLFISARY